MKSTFLSIIIIFTTTLFSFAGVEISETDFGKNLGGWIKRGKQAAEYPLSGSTYRTYKPEVSPTPDGGIFVSLRIDHVRGWLSSDDHATLEITVNSKGAVVSAQSNIAIQGRSISSDVILGSNEAGRQAAVGTDRAVQIGTDLVADLSAKLLREKLVEAGRVSFPAALRHNYNLLFQAVRVDGAPVTPTDGAPVATPANPTTPAVPPAPVPPAPAELKTPPAAPAKPAEPAPNATPLEIKPYGTPTTAEIPVKN
ncbi:MAG: hypothetical protein WEB53_17805 [Akkermansiaceae bacterium]